MGLAAPSRKTKLATETTMSNSSKDQVSGGEDNPVGLSMKRCSESCKEAAPRNLLSPGTTTKVGTWNVRTMYEAGKSALFAAEKSRYKLAVLRLCETRWTRSGQIRLATGETLIYSEHEDEDAPHTVRVGLILFKGTAGALVGWKAFSSRIISARFHTKIRKVLILHCYAPTNDSDAKKKIRVLWETPSSCGPKSKERFTNHYG